MVVIEGLRNGPVEGECRLTLYAEGGVIQHFKGKSVILGKWKALEPHGRLIDADALKGSIEGRILAGQDVNVFSEIDNAPTVLEASK